ncbi:MAG: hypothetical protein Q7S74_02055, partial [Nanoarchaeota archaeon]|nr:hypothetical protein [Nanoarchaeota archaeon]
MVLFIEEEGETWIAKPDRDFGRLQLDLYEGAFRVNEKDFDCDLDLKVFDNRTYVSKSSWFNLVEKVRNLTLEEMEGILSERCNCVQKYIDFAGNFPINGFGLEEMFNL